MRLGGGGIYNGSVERRAVLALVFLRVLRGADSSESLRGKLAPGPKATIQPPGTTPVTVTGDEATGKVLKDERLAGEEFEAVGRWIDKTHFEVNPIHTRSLFVHKNGKRLMVTYWCDVCYIRTYSPGICWCCQKDTDLDLRESIRD